MLKPISSPELTLMEAMGITIRWDEDDLIVYSKKNLKSIDIEVNPMTIQSDHHPFFVLLLLNADRRSVLVEKVWKDRFMYVDRLFFGGEIGALKRTLV